MTRGRPRRAPGRPPLSTGRGQAPYQGRQLPTGSSGQEGWCLCKTCYVANSCLPGRSIPLVSFRTARCHFLAAGTWHSRFWCDPRTEHLTCLPQPQQVLVGEDAMDVDGGSLEGSYEFCQTSFRASSALSQSSPGCLIRIQIQWRKKPSVYRFSRAILMHLVMGILQQLMTLRSTPWCPLQHIRPGPASRMYPPSQQQVCSCELLLRVPWRLSVKNACILHAQKARRSSSLPPCSYLIRLVSMNVYNELLQGCLDMMLVIQFVSLGST